MKHYDLPNGSIIFFESLEEVNEMKNPNSLNYFLNAIWGLSEIQMNFLAHAIAHEIYPDDMIMTDSDKIQVNIMKLRAMKYLEEIK